MTSNEDDATKDAIQYLLSMENIKSAIKDTEMRRRIDAMKTTFEATLVDSSLKLQNIMGCSVTTNEGRLMVCNILPPLNLIQTSDNIEEDVKNGLLVVLLTAIFLSINPVTPKPVSEAFVFKVLTEFGIDTENEDVVFGDIKKLIAPLPSSEFVQKGWLNFCKAKGNETVEVLYSWGPRAVTCVDPMELLETFCKMIDDPFPKLWKGHYTKAQIMQRDMHKFKVEMQGKENALRRLD
ncbi:unnamed protein product [Auanema sp. JU1783]|nr:unnamed protein product [Auanema sp. JU1783]